MVDTVLTLSLTRVQSNQCKMHFKHTFVALSTQLAESTLQASIKGTAHSPVGDGGVDPGEHLAVKDGVADAGLRLGTVAATNLSNKNQSLADLEQFI